MSNCLAQVNLHTMAEELSLLPKPRIDLAGYSWDGPDLGGRLRPGRRRRVIYAI